VILGFICGVITYKFNHEGLYTLIHQFCAIFTQLTLEKSETRSTHVQIAVLDRCILAWPWLGSENKVIPKQIQQINYCKMTQDSFAVLGFGSLYFAFPPEPKVHFQGWWMMRQTKNQPTCVIFCSYSSSFNLHLLALISRAFT
jgi:hypothetical protein